MSLSSYSSAERSWPAWVTWQATGTDEGSHVVLWRELGMRGMRLGKSVIQRPVPRPTRIVMRGPGNERENYG
jgi:hypothetical protein